MQSQIQFVPVSGPTRPMSSESRKLCHSHATRQAHAKKRRLRVQKHQKEVKLAQEEDDQTFSIALVPLNSTPNYHKGGLFTYLASSLAPAEYDLLRYYFSVMVPYMAVNCALFNFEGDHGLRILRDWVGLAIADKNFLDTAILLCACQNILRGKPEDNSLKKMALQYKQKGLETLRHALNGPIRRVTVATGLALALDEMSFGDTKTAIQHCQGVVSMVEVSGGPTSLGLSEMLERLYWKHAFPLVDVLRHEQDEQVDRTAAEEI